MRRVEEIDQQKKGSGRIETTTGGILIIPNFSKLILNSSSFQLHDPACGFVVPHSEVFRTNISQLNDSKPLKSWIFFNDRE